MKRTAKVLVVIALVLCGAQSSNLNAKDKNIVAATGDDAATNLKMLQGKWQAVNDKSDFLVFENNQRKEKAGGETEWDVDVFVLTDKPMNDGKVQDMLVKYKSWTVNACLIQIWPISYISLDSRSLSTLSVPGRAVAATISPVL